MGFNVKGAVLDRYASGKMFSLFPINRRYEFYYLKTPAKFHFSTHSTMMVLPGKFPYQTLFKSAFPD
jgi:hypothetical protein